MQMSVYENIYLTVKYMHYSGPGQEEDSSEGHGDAADRGPYFHLTNDHIAIDADILDTEYADSPRVEAFRQRLLREIDDHIWKKTLENELSLKVRALSDSTRVMLRDTSRKYIQFSI